MKPAHVYNALKVALCFTWSFLLIFNSLSLSFAMQEEMDAIGLQADQVNNLPHNYPLKHPHHYHPYMYKVHGIYSSSSLSISHLNNYHNHLLPTTHHLQILTASRSSSTIHPRCKCLKSALTGSPTRKVPSLQTRSPIYFVSVCICCGLSITTFVFLNV